MGYLFLADALFDTVACTRSRWSRLPPLHRTVWCFRKTEQPASESQIPRRKDRPCVTGRCEEQLAQAKVIQTLTISPAPSPDLSGSPGSHRLCTSVCNTLFTELCSNLNATHLPTIRTTISSGAGPTSHGIEAEKLQFRLWDCRQDHSFEAACPPASAWRLRL